MSPLPSRGSPPLQSGGQNQKWPTCGQGGYVTLAVSGIPNAAERGGEIRIGRLVGKVATSPLPSRGSPPLQSGGQNKKWPTCGQSGYVTLAVSGIPTAAERGGESEVAHLWPKWLRHPCRLRDPHRCRAGGKIRNGPLMGKVATSPLPSRGSPPLQSGGQNQKWPTYGQSGYVTPAVSGIPTAAERGGQNQKWPTCGQRGYVSLAVWGIPTAADRGGKIRSGPVVGKVATSPLPSRGSPPLQSGGGKSEVAHLWAKWLRHPCRLKDPHRFRAGGKIRSGPLVGKVATSALAISGIPTAAERGGKIRSGPLVGKVATSALAVSGIPTAAERGGGESEVAHLWAKWLRHPYRLGDPHRFRAGGGGGSEAAHLWAKWLCHPCRLGDPQRFGAGGKIRSGPLMGKVATSPLPSRGSQRLQSGGQNQKWPTCGQSGYVTPAVSGIPTASERGAKSEVAHLWAKWLCHPCHLGDPHRFRAGGQNQKWPTYMQSGYVTPAVSGIPTAAERGGKSEVAQLWGKWLRHPCRQGDPNRFRAGDKIRSGPLMGKVATPPLPSGGSPPLQSGGGNQKWPTCGQSGYVTPAVSGIPTAAGRGGGTSKLAHCGQSGYVTPAVSGIPTAAERGAKSEVAHLWAKWLRHPCRLGDPHRFRAGGKIRNGPLMGKVATSPVPSRGSLPLQSGGQNQKWPTYGQSGYVSPAVSRIPTASKRGAKSEVAHLWAKWLRQPLPSRGSPPLRSGGQNQKWPTCGQSGYVTPTVSGIPTASERGAKSEVAHLWAKWLRQPLPSQGSPPLQSGGGGSEVAHLWAKWLRHPYCLGDPHRFRAGGGGGSKVAHLWAKWLCHPCRLGDPHRFGAGGKIRSGPLVGKVATSPLPSRGSQPLQTGGKIRSGPLVGKVVTSPLPSRGSQPLQSWGQNQKWPTYGQKGYATPAVSGIPTASKRWAKSEVAHLWAKWLCHPCRLGDPHRFRAVGREIRSGPVVGIVATSPLPSRGSPPLQSGGGGGIRSGPLMGKVATSPLPSQGSPPLRSGGQNQKWPTYGQSGYVTPAVSGIPTASERGGGKSEVAHLWAKWLRHPCRLGDPHRFRAGGKIRSGPLMGKVATSPLPSRGSPPLHSGGGNQKWPTYGQSGYVTPAVSGIPTASERGAKSEVAHLWAKGLRHPCRLGDPHRFRAVGKIRSGPLVGKVAMSPLPSRGSPPLQSGGEGNQKCPTCGQSGYATPAVSGIPTAAERGKEIRSGPLMGKRATPPLPSRGSPPLQSGGQNQKCPTCGQSGYATPAVSEIPTAAERGKEIRSGPLMGNMATSPLPSRGSPPLRRRGAKSEVAHVWAWWLRHPCRLRDPHRFRAGGKIRSAPLVGKVATSPLPSRGSPPL